MASEILHFIHPWYEDQQFFRVMAVTRETSRFGQGTMARTYIDIRGLRQQNLEYVRKARRMLHTWSLDWLVRSFERSEEKIL